MSSDIESTIRWRDIWAAVSSQDKVRERALRETLIVLFASLTPLFLGPFLTYVRGQHDRTNHHSFYDLLLSATLGGQLFLLFISLAGTIVARLADADGPKYQFQGLVYTFHIAGWAVTAGLLAIDPASSTFSFWPVGALSLFFFVVAVINYFVMAVPTYIEKPDLQETATRHSNEIMVELQSRMEQ